MTDKTLQIEPIEQVDLYDYKNSNISIERRVNDLLHRMTLEEKVAQMLCIWRQKKTIFFDEVGNLNPVNLDRYFKNDLGQIGRLSDTDWGTESGQEVVKMYIRNLISSVMRTVKELKGFKKIRLGPGESKAVALPITPEHLAFADIKINYVVAHGEFDILVANSSRDQDLAKVILNVI